MSKITINKADEAVVPASGKADIYIKTDGTLATRDDTGTESVYSAGAGGDALVANPLSQFASTTSAQLAGVLADETGTGSVVLGTSPNITSPTGIVKADVGLANVDNTADLSKPVSNATQTALDAKVDDGQVLTNVPGGAVFTDTTDHTALSNVGTNTHAQIDTHIADAVTNTADSFVATAVVNSIVTLSQVEYDAIVTKDANTLYVII